MKIGQLALVALSFGTILASALPSASAASLSPAPVTTAPGPILANDWVITGVQFTDDGVRVCPYGYPIFSLTKRPCHSLPISKLMTSEQFVAQLKEVCPDITLISATLSQTRNGNSIVYGIHRPADSTCPKLVGVLK